MRTKFTITILSLTTLLFSACSTKEPKSVQLDEKTKYEITQKASKTIEKIQGTMQMKLYEKIQEGGIANAASFCSINASKMGRKALSMLPEGVSIKRITDKPRNMKNLASKEQLAVLDQMREKLKTDSRFDMIIKQKAANHFQVYKPITIMGACLKCHGTAQTKDEKAYAIISKNYPNDKAINYKLYDLRGAFLVDIIQ